MSLSLTHSFYLANESCKRRLNSNNLTEHDGEVYCRSCYGRLFGPKGYGFGGGAGVLSMDSADGSPVTSNIPATAQAFIAPKITNGNTITIGHGNTNGSTGSLNTINNNKWGGPDICPRCGKVVYMAEKMMGGGAVSIITFDSCQICYLSLAHFDRNLMMQFER